MTLVIGLTGGIGSGKSTVARYLSDFGAVVIDADKVGHELFRPGTPLFSDVVAAFGTGIIAESGEIDRKRLGQIVFASPESRRQLNEIMWGRMREEIEKSIADHRRRGAIAVVVEAFGLIEAGWKTMVDEVWVTEAGEEAVVQRLKTARNLDESDATARIRSQMSNEERQKHAQVVVRNDGTPEALKSAVTAAWESALRRWPGSPG